VKYFTIEEAEAQIDELESIFASALELRAKALAKADLVKELEEKGDAPSEAALERGRGEFLIKGFEEQLDRIVQMGAVPKGLEPGLVDFPYRLEDQEVYLCWTRGEKKITHYHGLAEGFSGRRPLPRPAPH